MKEHCQKVEKEYEQMKQEFERIKTVIGEIADALDEEFPQFVVEEDKTLVYKQMIISKDSNSPKKEKPVESVPVIKNKFHPFSDELHYKMYKILPDFSKFVLSEEDFNEIKRIESMDVEELMAIELKKYQD